MNNIKDSGKDPEQGAWRFELKYRISIFDYYKIRIAIVPYMRKDHFTQIAPSGKYLVRSLYYDTYDYRLYQEKMNGDHERVKFRLRTYSREIDRNPVIRTEMKIRKGNATEKHGVLVTVDDYCFFKNNHHWPNNTDPVLNEFERCLHLWALQPKVLVEYFREGYEDRNKKGLRITFDHKVSGIHADTLFPPDPVFFREFHPHILVLEIKCRQEQPTWLRNLIREYGLRWVANSKFTQGIQCARKDLHYPGGVVVVR